MLSQSIGLAPVLVPDTGTTTLKLQSGGKHTDRHLQQRTLAQLWESEGEWPVFEPPTHLTELQIWHRGVMKVLTGLHAARCLSVVAPTVFSTEVADRGGAVAQAYLGERLAFRMTGSSLARSYAGAIGVPPRDAKELADRMLHPKWRPRAHKGEKKSQRFFDCVIRVFTYFHLQARRYDRGSYSILGVELVRDMLRVGRCRTSLVESYLEDITVLLHGSTCSNNEMQGLLLSLPIEERASLWKTQRLFAKDDNNPIDNARLAMERMTLPISLDPTDRERALIILKNYQRRATNYVEANEALLRVHHDTASLHRSSASTFFTRGKGGGAAEMHLTVALHRLAKGVPTVLQDVWGHTPDNIELDDLLLLMDASTNIRKEIGEACMWMLHELERHEISYPYLCIYPEREVKSRCFMILPYCIQQGGYQAATTVGRYLKSRNDTREVFSGFSDSDLLRGLRMDIESGATHLMSLDSKVATDPLQHEFCRMIFEPFYRVFSEYTRAAVEKTFSPTLTHVALERPSSFLERLAFTESIMTPLTATLSEVGSDELKDKHSSFDTIRTHPNHTPISIRTYQQKDELAQALMEYGRVIVKAPTGSGKTVLVSTFFNSIVQFPSVVALELMSQYLTTLGKPHNVWHAERKTDPIVFDEVANEPFTILCTSFFIRPLSDRFPCMVVALDEAETKQENYLINLESSRRKKGKVLLMSATPEELLGEETTHRLVLQGGTNFPIEERRCTYAQMIEILTDPESPNALVCAHSEPLCAKLSRIVISSGKTAIALTARERAQGDYLDKVRAASVVLGTNAIRSSITLPDLDVVFDLSRIYENIDFPLSGMEALILMEASEAMRVQCRGRVGRVQKGYYYLVTDAPGDAIPYTPKYLSRVPAITRLCESIPVARYARELNHGSIVLERYSQLLFASAGVKHERFCPGWASVIRQLATGRRKELLRVVAFEAMGLVNRTQQLAEDLEMRSPLDVFKKTSQTSYHLATLGLLEELKQKSWFPSEIKQLIRWGKDLEDESSEEFLTPANELAVALALWRQISIRRGPLMIGLFRNFSVKVPIGNTVEEEGAGLVLGLSLRQCAVTARWTLPVSQVTVAKLRQLMAQVASVSFCPGMLEGGYPTILGWDTRLQNSGKQTRTLELCYDQYSRSHVFQPQQLEDIWKAMKSSLDRNRVSKDALTHQGSPMSATASFTVLNSFGLSARDAVRDGLFEGVKEPLHGGGVFGDDDLTLGSMLAVNAVRQNRESLGLETKMSATGIANIAQHGRLLGVKDQIGLFTERVISLDKLAIVPAVKPAGLIRMFHSGQPDELMLSVYTHRPDMFSYEKRLAVTDARWHEMMLQGAVSHGLHAVRETAPRRLLSKLFRSRISAETVVAVGDVDRLFANLELMLLQVCPSTRGAPSRLADPGSAVLGHPLISKQDADMMAEYLQGQDCYFKLHGPPLKTQRGPWGFKVAAAVLRRDINNISPEQGRQCIQLLGWGTNTPAGTAVEYAEEIWQPLEPLEFGDSRD